MVLEIKIIFNRVNLMNGMSQTLIRVVYTDIYTFVASDTLNLVEKSGIK